MTWQTRLKPTIKFTSPEGNKFEALWVGGKRSKGKKLGIFSYPKVKGDIVQDLGVSSDRYPLTFYFEGPDNDIEAQRFWVATKETGQWEIIHPVHGFMSLQFLSIEEDDQPVVRGNVTQLSGEWIEPIDEETLQTVAELKGLTGIGIDDFNISAADQFVRNLKDQNAGDRFSISSAVGKVTTAVDKVFNPIAQSVDAIATHQQAVQRGIQDVLNATVLQPLSLAGQIQSLIQTPAKAIQDIKSRLDAYQKFAEEIFNIEPDKPDDRGRNTALVKELALTSVLASNGFIAVSGPTPPDVPVTGNIQSRSQTVEFAENLSDNFIGIVDVLDADQDDFSDNYIDSQYFSQSDSFNDSVRVTFLAVRYLLIAAFDMKVERRFILREPKTPIQITIEEYGSLGENDSNLDLFINSNGLKSFEILLLSSGREVLVYA